MTSRKSENELRAIEFLDIDLVFRHQQLADERVIRPNHYPIEKIECGTFNFEQKILWTTKSETILPLPI